jgi:hypothetical protein
MDVAGDWYAELRCYNNQLADVMLVDTNQMDMAIVAFGLRCNVYKIVESGESITITIKMTSQKEAAVTLGSALLLRSFHPSCIIEILVTVAGVPLPDIPVLLDTSDPYAGNYLSSTNSLGKAYFLVKCPESPTTIQVDAIPALPGYEFSKVTEAVSSNYYYAFASAGTLT